MLDENIKPVRCDEVCMIFFRWANKRDVISVLRSLTEYFQRMPEWQSIKDEPKLEHKSNANEFPLNISGTAAHVDELSKEGLQKITDNRTFGGNGYTFRYAMALSELIRHPILHHPHSVIDLRLQSSCGSALAFSVGRNATWYPADPVFNSLWFEGDVVMHPHPWRFKHGSKEWREPGDEAPYAPSHLAPSVLAYKTLKKMVSDLEISELIANPAEKCSNPGGPYPLFRFGCDAENLIIPFLEEERMPTQAEYEMERTFDFGMDSWTKLLPLIGKHT